MYEKQPGSWIRPITIQTFALSKVDIKGILNLSWIRPFLKYGSATLFKRKVQEPVESGKIKLGIFWSNKTYQKGYS